MDARLLSIGYDFGPSRYSPPMGFSELKVIISGKPAQRFFDVKALHAPTFDGKYYHETKVYRHELSPNEDFQVCLGMIQLESFKGECLRAFSFGGTLHTSVVREGLYCDLTTDAPIFKLRDEPGAGYLLVEELMDVMASKQIGTPGHENEQYGRLAKYTPYQVFKACLVSLQQRGEAVPPGLRRERFKKVAFQVKQGYEILKKTDGWDGSGPSLEELISG